MKEHNLQVTQTVWRRVRRPSAATIAKLKAATKPGYGYKVTVGQLVDEQIGKGQPVPAFYRELINLATTKCLGIELLPGAWGIDNRDRILGAWGGRDVVLCAPLELQRGHKLVVVKASELRPIKCREHVYPIT